MKAARGYRLLLGVSVLCWAGFSAWALILPRLDSIALEQARQLPPPAAPPPNTGHLRERKTDAPE